MEHCNCGEPCFTFEKFTQDKKFLSKRCGAFSDYKKKKKCDYREDTFICNVVFPEITKKAHKYTITKKQDLRSQLNHYIHLYEISTKTGNISANINFILKQLNYKLFFDTVENIQDLKKRLQLSPDNIITFKPFKPVILVEVPEQLKVISEKCKKTKKYKKRTYKMSTTYLIRPTPKKHDRESERDSDSDSDVDENGGFDVENYDTDDNQDDFCDDGNFSD